MKLGLVLSGGISKCAYQVGFVRALKENADVFDVRAVSSSSAGIFTGYAFCTEKLDELEYLYRRIDICKNFELFVQVFAKNLLARLLDGFISVGDRLNIPLYFPVCYFPVMSVEYYEIYGDYIPIWKKYVRAATNFPFLRVRPNFLNGRFAFDGGAADNIPIFPLINKNSGYLDKYGENFDMILVLHFDARYDFRREFTCDIPILDLDVSYMNNFSKRHYDYSAEYVEEMICSGYEYGKSICKELIAANGQGKDELSRTVDSIFVREHAAREKNMSVDRFFSMLNGVGKALRNDSDCIKKLYL